MSENNQVIKIHAADEGILPNSEVGEKLNALLKKVASIDGKKQIIFEKGEYTIDVFNCPTDNFAITNCTSDDEFAAGEDPHKKRIAVYINGVSDLELVGDSTVFVLDGRAINLAISDSKNVTVSGISFKAINPDLHCLEVVKKGLFTVDYRVDDESEYTKSGSHYYFKGKDFFSSMTDRKMLAKSFAVPRMKVNDEESIVRGVHPFLGYISVKEKEKGVLSVRYARPVSYKKGDKFFPYDIRREYVGIFIQRSEDIVLDKINQYFNYGLGVAGQDSKNITISNCSFAPEKDSPKMIASIADFLHFCMCRGTLNITDNFFQGAGDDCLNVHGVHFKVDEVRKNGKEIVVRFMHPQTHGFNPLRKDDDIEFINPKTLLTEGKAKIVSSEQLDEQKILLVLDREQDVKTSWCIEDLNACANLNFLRNRMTRIITRGILVTTRGHVVIEGNFFDNTSMSSILFSDDAKSWYESGRVTDVVVRENEFNTCASGNNIQLKPENAVHAGYVHSNVLIENNIFNSPKKGGYGITIKSSDNVTIRKNKVLYPSQDFVKSRLSNVKVED